MVMKHKYEELAEGLAQSIRTGTFQPGAPVPSVRTLSELKKVSITTVLKAYYLLEAQGLIEARPRSGFYVSPKARVAAPEPDVSKPDLDPTKVDVQALVMQLIKDGSNTNLTPLGLAYPDMEIYGVNRLYRLMSVTARKLGVRGAVYEMPPGSEELRTQIARHSVASGCNLSPDQIVITNGCTEALSLCLRAVCEPGDTVALESPICFDTLQTLDSMGLRALEVPTHPREGISIEALRFALDTTPVQACMVISNYNNPLGSCMPDQNKKDLVEMLAELEIPLIENDIFGDLHLTDQRPLVAKSFDRKGLVMLCSSFSKNLCPGFHLGWAVPGRFRKKVEWLKYTTSLSTPTLTQLTVAEFLAGGGFQKHLRKVRHAHSRRLSSLRRSVINHFPHGIKVTRPEGGFLLWVQLPRSVDSLELYRRSLFHGISIVPGYLFSATDRYRNFIRLNAAQWTEDMDGSVRTLGRLVDELAAIVKR